MSIPISTTRITVLRPSPTNDPFEPTIIPPAIVASGVRAHISTSRGSEAVAGGQEVVYFRLSCDPVDLDNADRVEDEATGLIYEVEWARLRRGLGLDHTEAGLRQVEGVVSAPQGGF